MTRHREVWPIGELEKSVIRGCHLERVADLPFIFSYGSCGSFVDPHHNQEDHALFCFSIAFKDSCYKYLYNSFSKVEGKANYEHFFTGPGRKMDQILSSTVENGRSLSVKAADL